jgi:iron complex transport system ATP-binding protein
LAKTKNGRIIFFVVSYNKNMLVAENIEYKVGHKYILNDSSVSFEAGKFHVIMGANGAGKSTLLKLLAGSIHSTAGIIYLDKKRINHYKSRELAKLRAVLSQHYSISFPVTTHEIVLMGRYPYFSTSPSVNDLNICEKAMELMQVLEFKERDYATLSGGEAQKVQMSRVLSQIWSERTSLEKTNEEDKKILFLDEPVSHLDIKYQHQLLSVAKGLCEKHVTVIAILHDINLALNYADRILFMKQGKIFYETRSSKEVTTTIIKDIFDIEARIIEPGNGHRPVVVF